MSKERKSKLDAHAERLDEWLGIEKQTYDYAIEQLRQDGLRVSKSTLSAWWSSRQSRRLQDSLLAEIASGSQNCRELDAAYAKNPAPGMELLIRLLKTQIMLLTTKGQEQPELLNVSNSLTRTVMDFLSGETKAALEKQKLELQERRVVLAEKKAEAFDRMKAVVSSGGITPETLKKIEAELKLL